MFYDLIIHPSKIELVHRIFSPEKTDFTEKKLVSKSLDFKFEPALMEKGEHYQSLKNTLKEIIDPYNSELNSLNIVLGSSFFQIRQIICDKNIADYSEYINWEAYQTATDIPDNYLYGYIFLENEPKMVIALVRKIVSEYFKNILHELYSDQIDFKIGCMFTLFGNKDIFIPTNIQLKKPFLPDGSETSTIFDPSSAAVRPRSGNYFILTLFFLFLVSVTIFIGFFNPDFFLDKFGIKTDFLSPDNKPELTQTEKTAAVPDSSNVSAAAIIPAAVDSIKPVKSELPKKDSAPVKLTEKITPPEQPFQPAPETDVVQAPEFWNYISSLVKFNSDSIVYSAGSVEIYLTSAGDIDNVKLLDESKTFEYSVSNKNIKIKNKSFIFKNYKSESNYNNFIDVKNDHGLFSSNDSYTFNSAKEFNVFIKALKFRKIGFKKFVIKRTDEIVILTVYFG